MKQEPFKPGSLKHRGGLSLKQDEKVRTELSKAGKAFHALNKIKVSLGWTPTAKHGDANAK